MDQEKGQGRGWGAQMSVDWLNQQKLTSDANESQKGDA